MGRGGIVIALCLLVVACAGGRAPASKPAGGAPTPVSITVVSERVGSRYVYLTKRRRDNSPAYTLRSDTTVVKSAGEGAGRSDFTNPHILFIERAGQTLVADAPYAVILVKEKDLLMKGGVRAHTSDGMTLSCDMLTYYEASERLHGEGKVVVTTPRGEHLEGDRIDANLHLSEMRISHE